MTSHGQARQALAAAFTAAEQGASAAMLQAVQGIWWLDGYPGTTPELGAVSLVAALYEHQDLWSVLPSGNADAIAYGLVGAGLAPNDRQGAHYGEAARLSRACAEVAAGLSEPVMVAMQVTPAGTVVDPHETTSTDALWAGLGISAVVSWLMYRAVKGGPRRG